MPCAHPRPSAALAVAAVLALLSAPLPARPAEASTSSVAVEVQLARLANATRRDHGVPPVRVDVRLVPGARRWSAEMASRGQLAHDPGLANAAPPGTATMAENVGSTTASSAVAERIHEAIMASSTHRANLLDARYTDVGIGVAASGGKTYVSQRLTAGAPARVAGAVEPTADLAARLFTAGAAQAVVARDDVFADALAAGPLAGRDGPVLLTPPGPVTHPSVRLALERVVAPGGRVWLVGGTAAVSAGVEDELRRAGWDVRRVAGANRVVTAERVSRTVVSRDGRPGRVLVATSGNWPDAAAGGAFGAHASAPVLLAHPTSVPPETAQALADFRAPSVTALGGSAVLSDEVVAELHAERVAGGSRQGTAAEIARRLWGYSDPTPSAWIGVPAHSADAWTWALGAAPLAARRRAAVLLVDDPLSGEVRDYLAGLGYGSGRSAELVVHGPVPGTVADDVRALLR